MKILSLEQDTGGVTEDRAAAKSQFLFLIVTFAFSWLLLGLAALSANGALPLSLPSSVIITIATLGPALGAVSAAAYESGRSGVRSLLGQARRWRMHIRWYLIVLLGPALIMLAGFLIWRTLGGPRPPAPPLSTWLSLPVLILVLLLPALFEETGWRGFALPRLQSRVGWLPASLIIGVVWALWHAPIWFIPDAGFGTLPFPIFALFTLALSVLFTWIYNGASGSVLLPALAHAAINAYPLPWNTAVSLLPAGGRGVHLQITVTIVLVLLAILLVLLARAQRPARNSA
ncbi:MAG TPA: type II CAAX endopeptidase family protein [Anaerolineales bacterium]|nr:type II CAAX endopeptidase family protein [Anaerolineales bacterium]